MKFFKQRLLNNYIEDWTVVPISDSTLEEENNKKFSHSVREKISDEKNDEGELQIILSKYIIRTTFIIFKFYNCYMCILHIIVYKVITITRCIFHQESYWISINQNCKI